MRTVNQYLTSPSGNQRVRPNVASNRTTDPLESPVSVFDLADFIGVDPTDPLLPGFALAATQACTKHTNFELLSRTYTYRMDRSASRQHGYTGVAIMAELAAWWIKLPVWPVRSIESVTVDGDATTEFDEDLNSKPARVNVYPLGPVVIEYTAGHESEEDIDPMLILGIKQLAAYLYEHRGACDVGQAIKDSGAAGMWGAAGMVMSL